MARKASSGLAKFELVDSAITKPQINAGGARQRRVERRPRRVPEARGDIAVRPQQIGGAGLGVVARCRKPLGVDKAVLAADADGANALGRIDRRAIAKRQQRELAFPRR